MLNVAEEPTKVNRMADIETDDSRSARKIVDFLIEKGRQSPSPIVEMMTVTPEIATTLLARNPEDENRKISKVVVGKYQKDMANGKWNGLNGQTIVISREGYLNDGQHRLSAIIGSQSKIPTMVIFGADRKSRLTLDQNKTRTSGDYLAMLGVSNPNNVAAIAVILTTYENDNFVKSRSTFGAVASKFRPTKAEIHEYATKHLKEIEGALHRTMRGDSRLLAQPTRLAAAYAILARITKNKEKLANFFDGLLYGENLKRGDPSFTCRHRLMRDRKERLPVISTLETIFRAWNYHVQGKDMFTVVLKGDFPELER